MVDGEHTFHLPTDINVIAIPSVLFDIKLFDNDDESLIFLLKSQKPHFLGLSLDIIPKGGFITKKDDIRKLGNYAIIDGINHRIEGYIVLERTDEYHYGMPIFKVIDKEFEIFFNFIRFGFKSCDTVKINDVLNTEYYDIVCVKERETNEDHLYIAYIAQVCKNVWIDFVELDERKAYAIKWTKKGIINAEYRFLKKSIF